MPDPENTQPDEGSREPLDRAMPGPSKLVVAGYILAVVFPIVGFVIGVILINRAEKHEVRHGIWMIAISVAAAFILFLGLTVVSHGGGSEEEDHIPSPVAGLLLPSPVPFRSSLGRRVCHTVSGPSLPSCDHSCPRRTDSTLVPSGSRTYAL